MKQRILLCGLVLSALCFQGCVMADPAYLRKHVELSSDVDRAFALAEAGDAEAQYFIGNEMRVGGLLPKDERQGALWLNRAADQGHAMSQYILSEMYKYGVGVRQDENKAAELLRKAESQGDLDALVRSRGGIGFRSGSGDSWLEKTAIRSANSRAAAGDVDTQLFLAILHADDGDATKSAQWYQKAADQGNVTAQRELGKLYVFGQGVPQDDGQAASWFRKAANQGDAKAQTNLGIMYLEGKGVPQDDREALRWIRLSADQGYAKGQTLLGWMYAQGRGVARDDGEAARLYRLAADQGYADAQYNLGMLYAHGTGVPQDGSLAETYLRRAAAQGQAEAKKILDTFERKEHNF